MKKALRFFQLSVALLLIFILHGPAFSIEVRKVIAGAHDLDINQTLTVSIEITAGGEKIAKLIDPVPDEFFPEKLPGFCTYENRRVVCDINAEVNGKLRINYLLRAVATGAGFLRCPQVFYASGVKSCDLLWQYVVGRGKLLVEFLYNATVPAGFPWEAGVLLRNQGLLPVKGVSVAVDFNGTVYRKELNVSGGEIYRVVFDFAPLKSGERGVLRLSVEGPGINASKEVLIEAAAPGCELKRYLKVFWVWRQGKLQPRLRSLITVRNTGALDGNYTLEGIRTFVLHPGEIEFINLPEEGLTARAIKLICRDLYGNVHATKALPEKQVRPKKDVVVILFESVFARVNPWLLLLLAVFSVELAFKHRKDRTFSSAMFLVAAILFFGFFTHLYVLHLPLPSGETVFESLEALRERNIFGAALQGLLNLYTLSNPFLLAGRFLSAK